MTLSSASRVVVATNQVSADLGEEVVLLHLTNGRYFGLSDVAARIWGLIRDPVTVASIESVLVEEYDVEPDQCHAEVMRLLTDLIDEGLVEVREP